MHVAFVVRAGAATAEELLAHCRTGLAPYEVPREALFELVNKSLLELRDAARGR